ncbi:hypothetical protein WR25_11223 [Diploscapter pachys]|uniref:Uncharacterized protein n=1 Tax=Diploscapter pachys TaxID=2018661 RepID=A0A2A2M345_9BILA|nr:hypothetical protein WR25_11223 [Diploscapter pachys]
MRRHCGATVAIITPAAARNAPTNTRPDSTATIEPTPSQGCEHPVDNSLNPCFIGRAPQPRMGGIIARCAWPNGRRHPLPRGINRKDLSYGGSRRHHAAADRDRRPLRPPDPPLEPEDEALYLWRP